LKLGKYLKKDSGLSSKSNKNNDYISLDNELFDSISSMAMQFKMIPFKNEKLQSSNIPNLLSLSSF
jgi:hypothetical protein